MPLYRVTNRYRNRDTGQVVEPGTFVTLATPAGNRMVARGLVQAVERSTPVETATRQPTENAAPRHTGGGWYELPNGEKVQGKEAALKRMQG